MSDIDLKKTMRMNYLFDFYQSLLTDKQRGYLESYYLMDESLSEIAETFQVSRQAVYDNIKRTDELLEEYESKLKLFEQFERRQAILDKIKEKMILLDQIIEPSSKEQKNILNTINENIQELVSMD